jgi:hypothetical protein
VLLGRALLLRIQTKHFELPIPFRGSIAQPRDVNANGFTQCGLMQNEFWGPEADQRFKVSVDAWEPYLKPADQAA